MSIIGKFLGLGQNDDGIISFNGKAFDAYADVPDQMFVDSLEEYKQNNKPAVTAAGIIALFEVL